MSEQQAQLLLVDDDAAIRRILANELKQMGFAIEVAEDLAPARERLNKHAHDVVVLDVRLPGGDGHTLLPEIMALPVPPTVIMLTGHGDIEMAVECMRKGAYDFLTKPCSLSTLEMAIRRALEHRKLKETNQRLLQGHKSALLGEKMVGESQVMQDLQSLIARVAQTDETVLVTGESGTGKELIAQAIWQASARSNGPFITVNCAAIAESLLESELFGHEKGAFSGADRRRTGMFELADGGTLLLDEVGEMPTAMQAKLLRVLQSGEVRRVGGDKAFHVDVRVIACTNRNLEEEVAKGHFREDLYYRIHTLEIHSPPLRERIDDLPLLCEHLLEHISRRRGGRSMTMHPEALALCQRYDWPGNVRELENVLRRASVMAQENEITPNDLPASMIKATEGNATLSLPRDVTLSELERNHILRTLELNDGNKMKTARILGITTKTLYNKLAAYGFHENE